MLYSFYHYDKSTHSASDFTTGYMNGDCWIGPGGVFGDHGNHNLSNCGSQTLIIITTTVMVEQLLFLSMDVRIDTIVIGWYLSRQ